jgi:tetratricopeptide (TPR) repeat protein
MTLHTESMNRSHIAKKSICSSMFILSMLCNPQAHASDWQTYQDAATQYYNAGQYSEAIASAQKAQQLAEKGRGQTKPYIASSINLVAMARDAQGNSAQAISDMQRAIALFQQSIGVHENTATTMLNLARIYEKQHQTDEAIAVLQQADTIMQSVLSTKKTAQQITLYSDILNKLRYLFIRQGNVDQADTYAQQQFDLTANLSDKDIPDPVQRLAIIRLLTSLAHDDQKNNRPERSSAALATVFRQFTSVKNTLPQTAWQADYATALELNIKNLQNPEQISAARSDIIDFYTQLPQAEQTSYAERLASHYNELGLYYYERNDIQQAVPYFDKSDQLIQQTYGKGSIQYARLLTSLAHVNNTLAQAPQALAHYKQAQTIYAALLNQAISPITAETITLEYVQVLNNLGALHYKMRAYEQAEQTWQSAATHFMQYVTGKEQALLPVLENLIALYRTQHRKNDEVRVQTQINQIK